jgi:hypothetical protein
MSTDEFILILKTCFLNVGLNPVVRSPIRVEVLAKGRSVGEVFTINDTVDGFVYTSCDEYADLFEGICEGVRTGWKAAKGELSIEA